MGKTQYKGDVGSAVVLAELTKKGYTVSIPFTESARYDLIVDKAGTLYKVQVKCKTPKSDRLEVPLCSNSEGGSKIYKYTADDIDLVAAVDLNTGKVYYIPASYLPANSFTLRYTAPKNGQLKGIHMASDFEDF